MQVPVPQWRDANIILDDLSIRVEDEITLVGNRVIMRKGADAGQLEYLDVMVTSFQYLIPLATIFTIGIFCYTLQSL